MAWGVNTFVTLPKARDVMAGFAQDCWVPTYKKAVDALVVPNAVPVTVAAIAGETVVGAAMLGRSERSAQVGMLAGAAWCTGLLPVLTWPYIAVMPPLIVVQLWLFRSLRRSSSPQRTRTHGRSS